tara:strand:+ start:98 stop:652 length:555 start_codon:yes stop_codon:yes gene_type:complete
MNFSKHCDLCENEITNLEKGLTCKLTNKKPEFKNTCSKINLNEKFQAKIEIINLELEIISRNKRSTHQTFYFLLFIGFILIIGGYYFFKGNTKSVYAMEIAFGIISIGITFWGVASNKLTEFRRKFNNAEFDKFDLDEFLEKYGIEYKSDFSFKEKIHGIQEVIVKMNFKNWKKKRTETTYKIN